MTDSILDTIKKLLGLNEQYTAFDEDVKVHINASIWRLRQLGVTNKIFNITDRKQSWKDYLGDNINRLAMVKRYIYLDVRLAFDPPTNNASLYNAYNEEKQKIETLLIYECDPKYEVM